MSCLRVFPDPLSVTSGCTALHRQLAHYRQLARTRDDPHPCSIPSSHFLNGIPDQYGLSDYAGETYLT